jgi:hypothetical protein
MACAACEAPPEVSDPPPGRIDFHAHARLDSPYVDFPALNAAMAAHDVTSAVFSPSPNPLEGLVGMGMDTIDHEAFFLDHPIGGMLYGGTELVPLLHAAGRTPPFTPETFFPHGPPDGLTVGQLEEMTDEMNTLAADLETCEAEFERRASQAAESGRYAGFGELAPTHEARRPGHPYIVYPADHPWMLRLSDLAAAHGMFLDVHLDAGEAEVRELERLLEHERATRIVWEHAGWGPSGYPTPAVLAGLLEEHPNLYLGLKLRYEADADPAAWPLAEDGTLEPDWRALLEGWPDRIVLGGDLHYWQDDTPADDAFAEAFGLADTVLDQLDDDVRRAIEYGTAESLLAR